MNCEVVASKQNIGPRLPFYRGAYWIVLFWCGAVMFAQNPSGTAGVAAPSDFNVIHVLGIEGAPNNAKGKLTVQDHALQFEKKGGAAAQVNIGFIQDVVLGEQSKQLGGTAATLGKAGTPFGGGRVISLFAHKKYDLVTLVYQDANGGLHGAIFQLDKGQGQVLKSELVAEGARVSPAENQTAKDSTPEVKSESK